MVSRRLDLRLALWLTVLVVIVNTVSMGISVRLREREIRDTMVRGADQLSQGITSAAWHSMLADRRETAYQVMETIATKQGIDRIRIFNKEGRVTFSTDPHDVTMVDKRAEACYVCHASGEPLVRLAVPTRSRIYEGKEGKRKLGMVTPIYNEPSCSTASCHAHPASRRVLGVLDVSLDLDPMDRDLAAMKTRAWILSGTEILLITAAIIVFTRRFVRKPIRRLVLATEHVSAMRLDRPVRVGSFDDLGELEHSFNEMRMRLKESVRELNELAQSLEQRVEERTRELAVAQRKLIQSDRLASLGQLAASVAHEINNPVAGILNLATLSRRVMKPEGVPPERLEEFRGYLDEIITQTARVGRIVSDLLAFSRRPSPHRGPADLNSIVRKTVALLDHKIQLAGARLEEELREGLPEVHCDASQIQQVVINLVSNAVESLRGEGVVTVRTRRNRTGDAVVFEVSDTGSGIPPELLGRIFDPFFTTKEEGKGTGLGLAVTYGIITAHNGDIEVKSPLGVGTTVRVTLPLAPVAAEQAAPTGRQPGIETAPPAGSSSVPSPDPPPPAAPGSPWPGQAKPWAR